MFGGMSQAALNDLKVLDPSSWEWKAFLQDNIANPISRRFGHTMNAYKDYIIIFGGGGQYIQRIKRRETFNDV